MLDYLPTYLIRKASKHPPFRPGAALPPFRGRTAPYLFLPPKFIPGFGEGAGLLKTNPATTPAFQLSILLPISWLNQFDLSTFHKLSLLPTTREGLRLGPSPDVVIFPPSCSAFVSLLRRLTPSSLHHPSSLFHFRQHAIHVTRTKALPRPLLLVRLLCSVLRPAFRTHRR